MLCVALDIQSTAVTRRDAKIIHVNTGLLEASYIKVGLHSWLAQSRLNAEREWNKKKKGNKINGNETAVAWTQCTHEAVCWDLALASPRPPTLWLKQIPSSEPPPSLYLYLAVSNRRNALHQASSIPEERPACCSVFRWKKCITFSKELINLINVRQCPEIQGSDVLFWNIKSNILSSCLWQNSRGFLLTDICPSVFASYPFHYYDH